MEATSETKVSWQPRNEGESEQEEKICDKYLGDTNIFKPAKINKKIDKILADCLTKAAKRGVQRIQGTQHRQIEHDDMPGGKRRTSGNLRRRSKKRRHKKKKKSRRHLRSKKN